MGGLTQFRRCYLRNLAQECKALFDFLELCMECLTSMHGGLQVLAFGLGLLAAWQAKALGVWCTTRKKQHLNML